MRISVRKEDPGYHTRPFDYYVLVNGVRVNDCFTADEETQQAFCFVRDAKGDFVLNKSKTKVVEKILTGKVEIVKKQDFEKI